MTSLEQLKTEHPAVYKAAVKVGVQQERDRIAAHVTMGQKVDDVRLAIRSIRSGAELASTLAHYLAAGRNRADVIARLEDDLVVEAAISNIEQAKISHVDPFEKQVADRLAALLDTSAGGANIEDLEDA